MDRIVDISLNDKTIAMRTKGVGVMSTEDAIRMGAVGPHAQGLGRKDRRPPRRPVLVL